MNGHFSARGIRPFFLPKTDLGGVEVETRMPSRFVDLFFQGVAFFEFPAVF